MTAHRFMPTGPLTGRIRVPGDKSISHRALMFAALAVGRSRIEGLLEGEDVLATAAALRMMGAAIAQEGDAWVVDGVGVGGLLEPNGPLDMGNSGTSARLLMGLLASHGFTASMVGDASLSKRPMGRVIDPLSQMGAQFTPSPGGRLPLTMRGEIVTPNWLLTHPADGYVLITSEIMDHLDRMGRENWLVRMGLRVTAVRERAALLEVALDEDQLRVAVLASSRAALEAERDVLRRVYPDSDHSGLATILDRSQLSDEDLIVLVSAAKDQYVALASIVDAALQLASQVGVPLDTATAGTLLSMSRREIFALVDERTANFARCGIERIDDWADAFRVERRMPLPRAAALLGVPLEQWQPPPKQQ